MSEIITEANITSLYKGTVSLILFSDKNASLPAFTIFYDNTNETTDYRIIEGKPRVHTKIKEDLWKQYRNSGDINIKKEYDSFTLVASKLRIGTWTYEDIIREYGIILHKYNKVFTLKTIKDKKSLYQLLCVDNGLNVPTFKKYFGEIEESTGEFSDASLVTEFKGMKLYFPTGMRESRKKEFMRVLEDLKNLYTKHGLGKAIEGDVKFVKTNGNALGTYNYPSGGGKGYIKIDPSSKHLHKLLYVLIHEFAHRVYYELIPSKIPEIEALFKEQGGIQAKRKQRGGFGPIGKKLVSRLEVNDWLTIEKGQYSKLSKRWRIVETHPKFRIETEFDVPGINKNGLPGRPQLTGPSVDAFLSAGFKPEKTEAIDIERVAYSHQYSEIQKKVTSEFFSTGYAEVNPSEWFAETVTMYMIDSLEGEIKEIIEKYLKAAK